MAYPLSTPRHVLTLCDAAPGLDIYDRITQTKDYYLFNSELDIFKKHGPAIVSVPSITPLICLAALQADSRCDVYTGQTTLCFKKATPISSALLAGLGFRWRTHSRRQHLFQVLIRGHSCFRFRFRGAAG